MNQPSVAVEFTYFFLGRIFDCNRWLAVDEEDGKVQNNP